MDWRQFTSIKEEVFNSITHGLGILLGIFFTVKLLTYDHVKNDPVRLLGFAVFGIIIIFIYVISTLFHSLTFTKARKVFKILDHSFIFLLIAASYTPFVLISLRGKTGWGLLFLVWTVSILGVVFKILFHSKFDKLSVLFYLIFGWLSIFIIGFLQAFLSSTTIYLLVLGGLFYSSGVGFYLWKRLPFNHGIWHLFVLGGTICHAMAVYYL